jgi:hypothetical protein
MNENEPLDRNMQIVSTYLIDNLKNGRQKF